MNRIAFQSPRTIDNAHQINRLLAIPSLDLTPRSSISNRPVRKAKDCQEGLDLPVFAVSGSVLTLLCDGSPGNLKEIGRLNEYINAQEHHQPAHPSTRAPALTMRVSAFLLVTGLVTFSESSQSPTNLHDTDTYGSGFDGALARPAGDLVSRAQKILYGESGPAASDPDQGGLGDCPFIASEADPALSSARPVRSPCHPFASTDC